MRVVNMPHRVPLQKGQQSISHFDTWQLSNEVLFHCLTPFWLTTHFQFRPQRAIRMGSLAIFFCSFYAKRLFTELFYEVCRFSTKAFAGRFKILFFSYIFIPSWTFPSYYDSLPPDLTSFQRPLSIRRVFATRWRQVFTFHATKFNVLSRFHLLKKKTSLDHWLHNHTALKRKPITYPFCLRFFFHFTWERKHTDILSQLCLFGTIQQTVPFSGAWKTLL